MTRRLRKSREQRGYGVVHKRTRASLEPLVRAGLAVCVYCGERIEGAWHLGHSDDRETYIGPTHPTCNEREAGLKAARLSRGESTVTSQEW